MGTGQRTCLGLALVAYRRLGQEEGAKTPASEVQTYSSKPPSGALPGGELCKCSGGIKKTVQRSHPSALLRPISLCAYVISKIPPVEKMSSFIFCTGKPIFCTIALESGPPVLQQGEQLASYRLLLNNVKNLDFPDYKRFAFTSVYTITRTQHRLNLLKSIF